MTFADDEIAQLVTLLSRERLRHLRDLTGSDSAAIELHQKTLSIGADLMKIIATIEISLRNAVSENLSVHFGVLNWLQQPPVSFTWKDMERKNIARAVDSAKRAEYSKFSQAEKAALDLSAYPKGRPQHVSHLKRAIDRRKQIAVSEGKVIAELTMHFWKRLYGPEYDQTLWRTTLKRSFPNKRLKRADVATQLERIYQSRNRLAHHEPVLHRRFREAIAAIEFVASNLNNDADAAQPALAKMLENDLSAITERERNLSADLDKYRHQ